MQIGEFQDVIERTYLERDSERGMGGTFMWFIEEVGELATALRENDREALKGEFADVLAWLCTLASLADIRMAVKVTSDTVQHGPDPVLGKRRLKRLARLARHRRSWTTIFTMPRIAVAATVGIVALLSASIMLPSLNRSRA